MDIFTLSNDIMCTWANGTCTTDENIKNKVSEKKGNGITVDP